MILDSMDDLENTVSGEHGGIGGHFYQETTNKVPFKNSHL